MRSSRLLPLATFLGLVAFPCAARAEEKAKPPTVVVRIQSIDDLVANFRYLAELNRQEEQAQRLEGLLQAFGGQQGLAGIDTRRPIGLYATLTPDLTNSSAVLLVP